jgi:PilZ domain-containing protein
MAKPKAERGPQPNPKQPVRLERRKYRRIATDQVISFAHVSDRDLLGVGRDLSPTGIRFEAVGCEIDLGDVIRVTFNVGEQQVVAVGRVIWSTEIDPISSEVGIEFIEIDPVSQQLLDELSSESDRI